VRTLVLHGETIFCAGAQKMLGYFAEGAAAAGVDLTIAMAPNPKLSELLPPTTATLPLPSNQRFSPLGLIRQTLAVRNHVRTGGYEILHGWTARDWELTATARLATGRPAVGLLHDHPRAPHISGGRQRLMRWCAAFGMDRTLCVSEAVSTACAEAGYPPDRLLVVQNGIPHPPAPPGPSLGGVLRLGYLGVFSERKGLRVLFQLIDQLGRLQPAGWELELAGGAQDDAGRQLVEELRSTYAGRPWWPRLRWLGWVRRPADFVATVDLLIVPSSEFDPFPTVLLEAGSGARPVFAARVGGVPEIVIEGRTGWMFDPQAPEPAAVRLAELLRDPLSISRAGAEAARQVRRHFGVESMARNYLEAYRRLLPGRRQTTA
jgi:glycosyltransferase involved in cell wall biosynthesis